MLQNWSLKMVPIAIDRIQYLRKTNFYKLQKQLFMSAKSIFSPIAALLNPASFPVMPLTAIWLNTPIWTAKDLKRRITEGDQVCIQNNELIDCLGDHKATHQITGCYGKPTSDFSITVIDLKTQELSQIKI